MTHISRVTTINRDYRFTLPKQIRKTFGYETGYEAVCIQENHNQLIYQKREKLVNGIKTRFVSIVLPLQFRRIYQWNPGMAIRITSLSPSTFKVEPFVFQRSNIPIELEKWLEYKDTTISYEQALLRLSKRRNLVIAEGSEFAYIYLRGKRRCGVRWKNDTPTPLDDSYFEQFRNKPWYIVCKK